MNNRGPRRMSETKSQGETRAENYCDYRRCDTSWGHQQQEKRDEKDDEVKGDECPEIHFRLKGGKEILLKPTPYFNERIIHPHSRDILSIKAKTTGASFAPQSRQAAIFEDPIAHRRMTAD